MEANPADAVTDTTTRLAEVRARIADAARRAGRDPADVTLVGASKTVPAERLVDAIDAGLEDLGENRAQELLAKDTALAAQGYRPRWHFLGRLQRNKVAALAPHVALWHSLDRPQLAEAIARRAPGARVLVEVNVGDEPQKGGCALGEVASLVDGARELGLEVEGLMTVPPRNEDPRAAFAAVRELAGRLGLAQLSMGMTADFDMAIEEGATIVRVGRALFGARPAP
ncbi:MAG TPA: YggS family pyridoxal phosphate-dependent enzyme [Acidimicrobiia bacterium]